MGRPSKAVADNGEIKKFDKYLVAVNRKQGKNKKGEAVGITVSVNIRDLIRANMPNPQSTIDNLNAQVEHQNVTNLGTPMIIYYFPAGKVKSGETYKANDIKHTYEDEETGEMVKTDNVVGLKIHLDKKIVGQDEDGKPIFE